jgi:hypothetical protein
MSGLGGEYLGEGEGEERGESAECGLQDDEHPFVCADVYMH